MDASFKSILNHNDGGTGSFVKPQTTIIKLLDPKDPNKVKAIHKIGNPYPVRATTELQKGSILSSHYQQSPVSQSVASLNKMRSDIQVVETEAMQVKDDSENEEEQNKSKQELTRSIVGSLRSYQP